MTSESVSANTLAVEFLKAEFPPEDVKTFNQAKKDEPPRWLSYVPDETVMDRLDIVLGAGNWTYTVVVADAGKLVALGTLGIRWPDSPEFAYYSDFGYPTNADRGESLKEASGDALRRCARYAGIARYIYAGHVKAAAPPRQPAAAQPAAASQDFDMGAVDGGGDADVTCPEHGERWYGTAEKGRYHRNGTWDDGKTRWCQHPGDKERKKARG